MFELWTIERRPDGQTPRKVCPAASTHLSVSVGAMRRRNVGAECKLPPGLSASDPLRLASSPLHPSLIFGSGLGEWPDCWVSAEFLRAPILQRCRIALPPADLNFGIKRIVLSKIHCRHKWAC